MREHERYKRQTKRQQEERRAIKFTGVVGGGVFGLRVGFHKVSVGRVIKVIIIHLYSYFQSKTIIALS